MMQDQVNRFGASKQATGAHNGLEHLQMLPLGPSPCAIPVAAVGLILSRCEGIEILRYSLSMGVLVTNFEANPECLSN